MSAGCDIDFSSRSRASRVATALSFGGGGGRWWRTPTDEDDHCRHISPLLRRAVTPAATSSYGVRSPSFDFDATVRKVGACLSTKSCLTRALDLSSHCCRLKGSVRRGRPCAFTSEGVLRSEGALRCCGFSSDSVDALLNCVCMRAPGRMGRATFERRQGGNLVDENTAVCVASTNHWSQTRCASIQCRLVGMHGEFEEATTRAVHFVVSLAGNFGQRKERGKHDFCRSPPPTPRCKHTHTSEPQRWILGRSPGMRLRPIATFLPAAPSSLRSCLRGARRNVEST